jgi:putative transcriptional regulator
MAKILTNLEFERRKRGLTQAQLGEAIMYSHAIISRMETGDYTCNSRLALALEKFFGMPIDKLLGPVGEYVLKPDPEGTSGKWIGVNDA